MYVQTGAGRVNVQIGRPSPPSATPTGRLALRANRSSSRCGSDRAVYAFSWSCSSHSARLISLHGPFALSVLSTLFCQASKTRSLLAAYWSFMLSNMGRRCPLNGRERPPSPTGRKNRRSSRSEGSLSQLSHAPREQHPPHCRPITPKRAIEFSVKATADRRTRKPKTRDSPSSIEYSCVPISLCAPFSA